MSGEFKELPVGANEKCFVGSGECNIPAVFSTDDGAGGIVFVCAHHAEEFEAWTQLVEQMPREQREKFAAAIIAAAIKQAEGQE